MPARVADDASNAAPASACWRRGGGLRSGSPTACFIANQIERPHHPATARPATLPTTGSVSGIGWDSRA
jgi:hypothetical protein